VKSRPFDAAPEKLLRLRQLYLGLVLYIYSSVAEPHHFYEAPAPGKNFDTAPALAPAPTLLYGKAKFLKRT
jgi:hypothetical protein